MTEAGMVRVMEAQAYGEWKAALQRQDGLTMPDDLKAALAENSLAQANFDRFPPSYKKRLIYWITSARTDKTRQSRIQKTVAIAAVNQRSGRM
ncbi:MAG TPA: YdeI/OmpD-associated family protein [Anaerolineales bacterium]|nr:YdeI/OmpD-associated family protein [Anaerolineales bacterium]